MVDITADGSAALDEAMTRPPVSANPVIPGFYPDPSICRAGDDYYLACSSFEYFPGVPIFRSPDLRHWEQIGNALERPSQLMLPESVPCSGGIFAPTLRHHDGRFYLVTTNFWGGGNLLFTADKAEGPWSEPVLIGWPLHCDPDLAWDRDGTCYLTVSGIEQARLDTGTGALLEEPRPLWSGTLGLPEAPHLYEIDGSWYLMIAEGGTERGHCVSIARADSPQGPFAPCPANPILTHRSTTDPIQNTGHGDLVQGPDGSWWLVFLGVRPKGGSPRFHVLGRETFLAPVTWENGWPVVGEITDGAAWTEPVREDFDSPQLHPRWISVRSRPPLNLAGSRLTLHSADEDAMDSRLPCFVGRRQQHPYVRVRTQMDGNGGLVVRMDERHHYDIEVRDGLVRAQARIGGLKQVIAQQPGPPGPAVLRLEVLPSDPVVLGGPVTVGPDRIRLGLEDGGEFTVLAELDGRYLSTEVTGGYTGRVIGVYATAGTASFDWLDYEPLRC
jgi:xylan 1,4-beta-xylosidase